MKGAAFSSQLIVMVDQLEDPNAVINVLRSATLSEISGMAKKKKDNILTFCKTIDTKLLAEMLTATASRTVLTMKKGLTLVPAVELVTLARCDLTARNAELSVALMANKAQVPFPAKTSSRRWSAHNGRLSP